MNLTAQAVFDKAFGAGRQPRSTPYKQGVMNCLRTRIDGESPQKCPYATGTGEANDYFAGVDEGRVLTPMGGAPLGFEEET